MAAADDLEEQIGVAVGVGQMAHLLDDAQPWPSMAGETATQGVEMLETVIHQG